MKFEPRLRWSPRSISGPRHPGYLVTWACLAATFPAGCSGSISSGVDEGDGATDESPTGGAPLGGGGGGGRANPGAGGDGTPPGTGRGGSASPSPSAEPLQLFRFTRAEYDNTVRDLLGTAQRPGTTFASDRDQTFGFARPGVVSTHDTTLFRDAAESLAKEAAGKMASLLPCQPQTAAETSCARTFIETFGRRAFRRPVSPEEAGRFAALYETARATWKLSFHESVAVVIEAMLQSPHFLYHWEEEDVSQAAGALEPLGPYHLASRLSYFLWGSMPDDELLTAAAEGNLATDAGLQTQVKRMLASPKARSQFSGFVADWLDFDLLPTRDKQASIYPAWSAQTLAAVVDETARFAEHAAFDTGGHLTELYGSRKAFLEDRTRPLYGAAQAGSLELDPGQRRGLFTRAAFLALNGASDGSHPVRRGHAVFAKALCGHLPMTPPNVPEARSADTGGTTRERFADHATNPCATTCHGILDPLGFLFEHYDGIGQYRTQDANQPVDATATVNLDGEPQPFESALPFLEALGRSKAGEDCFARQLFRFGLRRNETEADEAALAGVVARFTGDDARIPALMEQIALSKPFRFRKPTP